MHVTWYTKLVSLPAIKSVVFYLLYSDDSSSTELSSFSDSSQPRFGIVTKSYEPRKDDELRLTKGQRVKKLQYTNREGMMKVITTCIDK